MKRNFFRKAKPGFEYVRISKPRRTATDAQIITAYRSSRSLIEAGEKTGVNEATVWRVLHKHGIEMRRRGRPNKTL